MDHGLSEQPTTPVTGPQGTPGVGAAPLASLPPPADTTDRPAPPAPDLPPVLARVQALGARLVRVGTPPRLAIRPASARALLTDDERAVLRRHTSELLAPITAPRGAPAPAPPVEPTPVIVVGRRQITERDVEHACRMLGDAVLADYRAGRITKADAFAMTARGLTQLHRMTGGRR
jgi:hypothetical protein